MKNRDIILGPQGEPLELRYSDDQPREANGEFGSGQFVSGKSTDPDDPAPSDSKIKKDASEVKKLFSAGVKTGDYTKDKPGFMKFLSHWYPNWHSDIHEKIAAAVGYRYSPDQPREADGKFGSGGGMSSKEAETAFDKTLKAPNLEKWQDGQHTDLQAFAEIALKEGHPETDPLLNAIRGETFNQYIYRGIAVDRNDPILSAKSGDVIQLEPQSFSLDREIATEFTMLMMDPSANPTEDTPVRVVMSVGPAGPGGDPHGIVIGERGSPDYGPNGYDQKEVITAGHFRVVEAKGKRDENGLYRFISLRQEGIF